MIRAPALISAALWVRSLTPSQNADARDAANWFDVGATASDTAICGDLRTASRGLSVEQHAGRVLMHLRDESDRRA